jgi:hypothetical protein
MAVYAVALAGIVGFPLLWPTTQNSISRWRRRRSGPSGGGKLALRASRHASLEEGEK